MVRALPQHATNLRSEVYSSWRPSYFFQHLCTMDTATTTGVRHGVLYPHFVLTLGRRALQLPLACSPLLTSHSRTVLSLLPVATYWLLGCQHTTSTSDWWPAARGVSGRITQHAMVAAERLAGFTRCLLLCAGGGDMRQTARQLRVETQAWWGFQYACWHTAITGRHVWPQRLISLRR